MDNWEVDTFSVELTDQASRSDRLYANGRMQVPVYAKIAASLKNGGATYRLTDKELSQIYLVYYHDTSSRLHGGWVSSTTPGEYAGTLSDTIATNTTAGSNPRESQAGDDSPQYKKFWVSTTRIEAQAIAAAFKMPMSHKVVTTNDGHKDSYVTLTGIEPIIYTRANTSLISDPEPPNTGHLNGSCNGYGSFGVDWSQTNYYFTTNNHYLHKAELHWYERTGHDNGNRDQDADTRLIGSYKKSCTNNGNTLHLYYIWETSKETTKTVGENVNQYFWKIPAYTNITINQTANALCLTHIQFAAKIPHYQWVFEPEWHFNTWFVVYDLYGNRGVFEATNNDKTGEVVIGNSNRSLGNAITEQPTVSYPDRHSSGST
ncbi:uncharacterized protein N7482_006867 [Penicillium canariense]|uniref:Uncharacterized protein n=1 Tax=Penicillium canariense TaxID=189055 RepID=A0A9W9HVU1_9EURO|nr:uncharacterized protein N7482_006867 [Penicillium canariense]KAJ5159863.1 hypothetical protein N7482_006867 [Penicillium canariense]